MKKLSDLRPCDNCRGPVGMTFQIIRVSLALVKAQAVNEFLGMHRLFGGQASQMLIENFAPASADAVIVAGDQEPVLMTELVVCMDCYASPLNVAALCERRATAEAALETLREVNLQD